MGKIKINLSSGNVIEKPLVTCFQSGNGTYLILDNEANGSMGLPIICISKFNGNSAEKIIDQNEWISVKESLKSIIAGTTFNYIAVPEVITAQDDFFTQLTLPVASFDVLKNSYNVVSGQNAPVETNNEISSIPQMPEVPVQNNEIPMPPINTMEPGNVEQNASSVTDQNPVIDINMPTNDIAPISITPTEENAAPATIETPTMNPMIDNNVVSSAISPVGPITNAENVSTTNDDLAAIKDNFMKSCETMFDALVSKLQNK